MNAFPVLCTDRFVLRQFLNNDLENVFKGLSHPDVIRYYGVSYSSLADTNDQLIWFNELEKNGTGVWWAICDKAQHTFLGGIGFNDLSNINKQAEIGFWLLPEYWGQSIIIEVALLICSYGFKELGLTTIEAAVELENVNCIRVLNKLGFKHKETRENCELKNDRYISLAIYVKAP